MSVIKRNLAKRPRVLRKAVKPFKIWSKTNEVRNSPRRCDCRLDRRARHGSGPRPRGGFQRTLFRHRRRRIAAVERQRRNLAVRYRWRRRSEEHTSELQSLMRTSYAVFCLQKTKRKKTRSAEQALY